MAILPKGTVSLPNPPDSPMTPENLWNSLSGGVAKASKFLVRINTPRAFRFRGNKFEGDVSQNRILSEMVFLCEAAEFPGKGLQTVDTRYYGPPLKLPFLIQYNDTNMTFICRREMYERKIFDYWFNLINPSNTYDFEYLDDYCTNLDVFHFSEDGISTYAVQFQKAYPLMMNPIQTAWADDAVNKLTVTFTFQQWKTVADPRPLDLSQLIYNTRLENFSFFGAFKTAPHPGI